MRYTVCAALCGILLWVGCVERPPEEGPNPAGGSRQMRFGISSLDTRGNAVLSVDSIKTMGVFGYTTDAANPIPNTAGEPVGGWTHPANLLSNQKVTRSTPAWTYDPMVFWPADLSQNNTFIAYSPHSSEFTADSYVIVEVPEGGGPPTLRYSLPERLADQKDILCAQPVYNVDLESGQVTNGMVKYRMKHTMTWITFLLATSEVSGNPGESYSVNWLAFMADDLPESSTLDLETGVWSSPSSHTNVMWNLPLDSARAHNVASGETANLTDGSNRMMIFPIDIEKDMATLDLTFYYNPDGPSYDTGTGEYFGDEYYYYLPIPQTPMRAGVIVVYLINISPEGATVEFLGDNTIEDWLEGGEIGGPGGGPVEMY